MEAARDIFKLNDSPLTNWKDVTKREDYYAKVDSLELRRQLGEISYSEMAELRRVFGGNPLTGYWLRANSESQIVAS